MDFFLGILVGVGIGFLWGVWRATHTFIERIVNEPEEITDLMKRVKEISKDQPKSAAQTETKEEYRTEWHQGICYLYDSQDNFMAQGSDLIEAMNNAEKRFPGLQLNFRVNDPNKSAQ